MLRIGHSQSNRRCIPGIEYAIPTTTEHSCVDIRGQHEARLPDLFCQADTEITATCSDIEDTVPVPKAGFRERELLP